MATRKHTAPAEAQSRDPDAERIARQIREEPLPDRGTLTQRIEDARASFSEAFNIVGVVIAACDEDDVDRRGALQVAYRQLNHLIGHTIDPCTLLAPAEAAYQEDIGRR